MKMTAAAALSLLLLGGCSKTTVIIEGGGSGSGNGNGNSDTPDGTQTLVTFHASVEGRNMTRSMTPLSKNIQVSLLAYDGTSPTSGAPAAQGLYQSLLPGQLSGVAGYKMYLTDGIYNFYAVSANDSYTPPAFTNGRSEPLFNGIDYLWWNGAQQDVSSSQINIPIVFRHCATQVVFDVAAGDGITLNELVLAHISAPQQGARMDLATGAIPYAASYGSTTGDKMGINGFRAQYIMLPLKTTSPMQASFDVVVNGEASARTYSVEVPVPDGVLVPGDSFRFEAVISASGIELSSVDVTDWVDVDETGKPLYPSEK